MNEIVMMQPLRITYRRKTRRRAGMALMLCLFVMSVCFALMLNIYDTATLQMSALRNTVDYSKALYLANAAAHDALQQLEANFSWNTGISSTTFPIGSSSSYSATVANGSGSTVVVTATGISGTTTRKVQITVKQGT